MGIGFSGRLNLLDLMVENYEKSSVFRMPGAGALNTRLKVLKFKFISTFL